MVFLDTNIPMYAAGKEHPFKQPCINLLMRVAKGDIEAAINVKVLQEVLYRFWHLKKYKLGFRIFDDLLIAFSVVLPITKSDLLVARDILDVHSALPPRDALHVAVMRNNSIEIVYSYDKHLDLIPDINRIEPE